MRFNFCPATGLKPVPLEPIFRASWQASVINCAVVSTD